MSAKRWTEDEVNLLEKLYEQMLPLKEISERFPDRTLGAIQTKAQDLGLTNKVIKKNSPDYKAIYQSYDWCYERYITKGMTMEEMAEEAGCKLRTIQKWCGDVHGLNVRTFRKHKKLTEKQRELIMFSRLGDGHIDRREEQPLFIVSHAANQKDYLFWKYDILKDICNNKPTYYPSKPFKNDSTHMCQPYYRISTKIVDELGEIRDLSYEYIIKHLNEFGLSIFMLDDGSRRDLWELCVADYTDDEKSLMLSIFKSTFGLDGKLLKDTRYMNFTAESSRKIDEIILRNIPNDLDIIKYKIIDNNKITEENNYIYVIDSGNDVGLSTWFKQHDIYGKTKLYWAIKDRLDMNQIKRIDVNDLYKMIEECA